MDTHSSAESHSSSFSSKIKSLDFYRKLPQDISEKSSSGGFVSLLCATIIVALFVSEFSRFLSTSIRSEMVIDTKAAQEHIQINLEVKFFRVPCSLLVIEGRDTLFSANHMELMKIPLDKNSNPIIDHPPIPFDQTEPNSEKIIESLKNEEGCAVFGSMSAKKVSGFIYFNERRLDSVQGLRQQLEIKSLNFSHIVTSLSFGNKKDINTIQRSLEKVLSPLDNTLKNEVKGDTPGTLFQYYLNVVPIEYVPLYGSEVYGYQYTANSHKVDYYHKNNVVVKYDISPISVIYRVERESVLHFAVEISAIVGGIFTLARILDSMLYGMFKNRGKKADLE